MFANNDKIVLSLVNIKNFNDFYLNYSYTLPVDISINILKDFASIDVFEYHEGSINSGFIAFSIYVGEKSSLNDLITSNKKIAIKNNAKIENLDNPLLYRIINNKIIILRELNSNDIVVQNKEELQQVLKNLSLEFQNIKDTIQRIRKLN